MRASNKPAIINSKDVRIGRSNWIPAIYVLIVLGPLIVAWLLARPHIWLRIRSATVDNSGLRCEKCTLYTDGQGAIVVMIEKNPNTTTQSYMIWPKQHDIKWSDPLSYKFPLFGFTWNVPPRTMRMPSLKVDIDPKLRVDADAISFTAENEERVKISNW